MKGTPPVCPKPCEDEVVVQVITNAGQTTGSFCLPKRGLESLRVLNEDAYFPYYFAWNYDNDMTKPVYSEKPGQGPKT